MPYVSGNPANFDTGAGSNPITVPLAVTEPVVELETGPVITSPPPPEAPCSGKLFLLR